VGWRLLFGPKYTKCEVGDELALKEMPYVFLRQGATRRVRYLQGAYGNQKTLEATASGQITPVIDGIGHHTRTIWAMWRYRS